MSSATRPGDVVGTDDRVAALAQTLRDSPGPLLPRAAGTKDALSTPPAGASPLDVRALNGVIDYDPAELTFTAMAATPVREIVELLAAQRQYLPFDPPWADAGASLGGTVAPECQVLGATGTAAFEISSSGYGCSTARGA